MNKKVALTALSAALLLGVTTNEAAFAERGGKHQTEQQQESSQTVSASGDQETSTTTTPDEIEDTQQDKGNGKGNSGKGKGNSQGQKDGKTPSERVAQMLEEKYGIEITDEVQAKLDELDNLVTSLEAEGNLDAAEDVQSELVQENPDDVELYVKLGKIKEKKGDKGIKTYVNGHAPKFDVPPVQKEGRVLVPFRAIAEALDAEVAYDGATKTVTVTRGDVEVKLVLGTNVAYVNGQQVKLDVPAQTVNNRVVVPLRFLGEALKLNVVWEPETSSVIVVDEAAAETANSDAAAAEGSQTEADGTAAEDTATTGTDTTASETTEAAAGTSTDGTSNQNAASTETSTSGTDAAASTN